MILTYNLTILIKFYSYKSLYHLSTNIDMIYKTNKTIIPETINLTILSFYSGIATYFYF